MQGIKRFSISELQIKLFNFEKNIKTMNFKSIRSFFVVLISKININDVAVLHSPKYLLPRVKMQLLNLDYSRVVLARVKRFLICCTFVGQKQRMRVKRPLNSITDSGRWYFASHLKMNFGNLRYDRKLNRIICYLHHTFNFNCWNLPADNLLILHQLYDNTDTCLIQINLI